MRTRARALGHPIHPMLVVFPLGLFTTAVIFDLVFLLGDNETFSQVGFWNITAGVIGAILAALAGVVDWTGIPARTRAKSVGLLHGGLNSAALVLFVIAWIVRLDRSGHAPPVAVFVLQVVALVVASGAAWFGGELVGRLGVGVDEDAGVDAPSSLSAGGSRFGRPRART